MSVYTLESDIEKAFVNRATRLGADAFKFTSPGRRGVPDRLVLLPCGCVRFVELKAPGKKPRPDQVRMFKRFARRKQKVAVLDTVGLVDIWAWEIEEHIENCDIHG